MHHKAVNAVRNLMTSHDIDSRFAGTVTTTSSVEHGQKRISRVANLYLPLVAICLDNLAKVCICTNTVILIYSLPYNLTCIVEITFEDEIMLFQLYAWTNEGEVRIVGTNQNEHLNLVLNKIADNLPSVSSNPLVTHTYSCGINSTHWNLFSFVIRQRRRSY